MARPWVFAKHVQAKPNEHFLFRKIFKETLVPCISNRLLVTIGVSLCEVDVAYQWSYATLTSRKRITLVYIRHDIWSLEKSRNILLSTKAALHDVGFNRIFRLFKHNVSDFSTSKKKINENRLQ